ncbi:TPA: hypothetical protein IFB44_003211 [Escherichia coli]|uniref:hypothetical protein n=1 Tax=Escherichia coli TaxID=562 RepID=UPI000E06CDBD|nr:hypothetical protein [Escherichia coli]EFG1310026.1 hypothetical protein [Escherichia coli]EJD5514902.1 hypothetical protein [Escherichia coli]EJF7063067.1 hypothetical protein [Escherichia coli]MED8848498.1 hypothetical protein [Escherichia coli]
MAKNNDKIRVEIDGDSSGLSKSLQQAENKIDAFGKKAGGNIGGFASNTASVFGQLSTGIAGVAALSVGAGAAVAGLALKLNGVVKELNQLSSQSGMSVTQLQQLDKTFRTTGLGMEKLADINQDVMEKIGDAMNSGGGEFAAVMKDMGLNIEEYAKFVNQPNGGIQATLHLMDTMKKANIPIAQQIAALEAMASDASRLRTVYYELGSSQAILNDVANQTVSVTEDMAEEYHKFDQNLQNANDSGQALLMDFMYPVVREMNALWDWFNKGWGTSDFMKAVDKLNQKGVTPSGMSSSQLASLGQNSDVSAAGKANDNVAYNKSVDDFLAANKKAGDIAYKQLIEKKKLFDKTRKSEEDQAKAARDKAAREAATAAAKAKALREKEARERILAQQSLDKILVDQTIGTNERQLAEFERQQKEIVATIRKTAKTLGLSDEKLRQLLNDQVAAGAANRLQMINQMVGYSNPNETTNQQNMLLASKQVSTEGQAFLGNQIDETYGVDNTQYKLDQMNEEREAILRQNDLLIQDKETFEKRKAAITAHYAEKAIQIQNQEAMKTLAISSDAMSQIGNGMAAAFGESSAAAQAAFAVQKGITISMTIMKIQEALAGALAIQPWYMAIPQYAKIAGMGMSIISTAKGASAGQFHGGVDEIPANLNNKSFILKEGERVVQPEANTKLTRFLDRQESGGDNTSGAGEVVVNAPMYVYGADNNQQFQEKLKKHKDSIVQAVRDSQRRNS